MLDSIISTLVLLALLGTAVYSVVKMNAKKERILGTVGVCLAALAHLSIILIPSSIVKNHLLLIGGSMWTAFVVGITMFLIAVMFDSKPKQVAAVQVN